MVFTEDLKNQQLIAQINRNNSVEKYTCSLWACDNPMCVCNATTIEFLSSSDEDSPNQNISSHTIELDIDSKTLNNEKMSKEDLEFAAKVLAKLEEDDFRILHRRHFVYKNLITERADADKLEAYFDYQQIEVDGLMPAYNDVLPYGDQLQVTIDQKEYLVLDQYCLLPKCLCTDTTLTLIPIDGLRKGVDEFCSIEVNYRKQNWKNFERLSAGVSEQSLRSTIEEQIHNLYKKLSKRHLRLKAIYKHCKKQHLLAKQSPKLEKTGRNDPCPCGSGKKYKKCCLRKTN